MPSSHTHTHTHTRTHQMYAQRYGTVPIVHATGGLKDSVEQYEPGQMGGASVSFSQERT